MSEKVLRGSPLIEFLAEQQQTAQHGGGGLEMWERAFLGHFNLRGDPEDGDFLSSVQKSIGVSLPTKPNTIGQGPDATALWLGPDEWLLLTPPDTQGEIAQTLEKALEGQHMSVNDLSGGQTVIRLQGPHARDVISKGCSLDLHSRAFGPGQCAQSHIAKSMATITQIDDLPTYDLIVRRSFADYLARWLKDAGLEYGITVVLE